MVLGSMKMLRLGLNVAGKSSEEKNVSSIHHKQTIVLTKDKVTTRSVAFACAI